MKSFRLVLRAVRGALVVCGVAVMFLGAVVSAKAANVNLVASDALNTTSFNTGLNWSDATAPSGVNDYFTANFGLRTPASSSSFTFAGNTLEIDPGGSLAFKTGGAGVITVNNLRFDGGSINNSAGTGGNTVTLAGNINVLNTSTFNASIGSDNRILQIRSTMMGPGGININGDGANPGGVVSFDVNAKNYDGNTTINNGPVLRMGLTNALPFGAGKGNVIVNNGGSLNLNNFDTSINGLSGLGTVGNTSANLRTLTVGNNDASGTFDGTIGGTIKSGSAAAVSSTNVSLNKVGTGTQTLTGASNYSGTTTVTAGKLVVNGSITGTGAVAVKSGGTIGGTGNVAGTVTIESGGTDAPGASVGTGVFANSTWMAGGAFEFEINNAVGTPGVDWDLRQVTGTLDISDLENGPFVVEVTGTAAGLNLNQEYEWQFVTAGNLNAGVLDLNDVDDLAAAFQVDASGFTNFPDDSAFRVGTSTNGNGLSLFFAVIPEPASIGMWTLLGVAGLAWLVWKRRRARFA